MVECRLLIDTAAPGAWNMAVDEVLLEGTAAGGGWNLRFYGWSAPTISLGYFQPYQSRCDHPSSLECPLVRRASGGGALVHDAEITYSLTVPAGHPLAVQPQQLYRTVHSSLVGALASHGIEAELCEAGSDRLSAKEAFLCFQRTGAGDVLVKGAKIAGSAQRRRQGAVMQHGSLLLQTSIAAPELPGLETLIGTQPSRQDWIDCWSGELCRAIDMRLRAGRLAADEAQLSESLAAQKYARSAWNRRR